MKKHSGFTLIEAIIAVMLLSMIAMIFLTGIASQYAFLVRSKTITEDTFFAVGGVDEDDSVYGVEERIKQIRLEAGDPYTKTISLFDGSRGYPKFKGGYTASEDDFGIPIYYTSIDVKSGIGHIVSYVAKYQRKEFPVPTITNVEIQNTGINSSIGYANQDVTLVFNQATDIHDPENVLSRTYKSWFANVPSEHMSYLPNYKFTAEDDPIDLYNRATRTWSGGHMLIPNSFTEEGQELDDFTAYAALVPGSYIVATVTPSATSGKMGNRKSSNSVYISGLPLTPSNPSPIVHLDASFIKGNYKNGIAGEIDADILHDVGRFERWTDALGHPAIQTELTLQPTAFLSTFSNTETEDTSVAQYVGFEGGESMSLDLSFNSSNFTMFVVARGNATNNVVLECEYESVTWQLAMDELALLDTTNKVTNSKATQGKWNLLAVTSINSSPNAVIFSINDATDGDDSNGSFAMPSGNCTITVGSDGVDIAEIIIYQGQLDPDTDTEDRKNICKYLNTKYQMNSVVPPIEPET